MALLRAYAGEVDSLGAFPAKHVINTLTMMADDNKMSQAPAIAGLILGRINVAASNCKVPLLYLADSIIKNVGNPYRQLFTAGIVDAFNGAMSKVRCAAGLLGLRAPRETQPRQPPRHQPSSHPTLQQDLCCATYREDDAAHHNRPPHRLCRRSIRRSTCHSTVYILPAASCA